MALSAWGPVKSEYSVLGSVLVQPLEDPGEGEIDVGSANVTPGEEPGIIKNSIFVKGP
jgi:hypothetical protein